MRRIVLGVLIVALGVALAAVASGNLPWSEGVKARARFPHQRIGVINKNFPEPSGIVYHPTRKTLFVVSDEGHISEMKTDGTKVTQHRSSVRKDYEGITVDPSTGLLYVAFEGAESIIEIDPKGLKTKREFSVQRTYKGKTVMKAGGNGIEGITFVPDAKHAEGGTFYVAHQDLTGTDAEEVSAIFEVEVPLKTGKAGDTKQCRILRQIDLGMLDLAALHYDKARDRIYVLSDSTNTFLEITRQGKVLAKYRFPGSNQEGLTLDPDDHVYYTQDHGGIIKLKWLRK